ncbi:MAG: PfkB family carbohydrate kinase, partial [Myxococcota bacterium]|nr:PfkB family carbohydrate kinase [Myxococcota bacterium]
LIKASDEDLALLYPGCEPAERIQGWRASHRSVVLTEGAKGTQLWDRGGTHVIHRETVAGPIVDTVGAGDTFQAALLAWFSRRGALGRPLATDEARDLLAFATRAAGLCCRQSGCQPPTLAAVLEGS